MGKQAMRQQARKAALDVAARRRKKREERERRIVDLAVQVMTALGERDAIVAEAEGRAGAALRELTDTEGMTLAEAVSWCEGLDRRDASRLRQIATDPPTAGTEEVGPEDGVAPADESR